MIRHIEVNLGNSVKDRHLDGEKAYLANEHLLGRTELWRPAKVVEEKADSAFGHVSDLRRDEVRSKRQDP